MCVDIEINLSDDEHDDSALIAARAMCDPCSLSLYTEHRENGMGRFEALGRAVYNTHLANCMKLGMNEEQTNIEGKV